MENGKTLIVALVALIPVALWGATGIEVDESKSGAECQAPRASSQSHLKVTAWELRDQTDGVGELVQTREWLLWLAEGTYGQFGGGELGARCGPVARLSSDAGRRLFQDARRGSGIARGCTRASCIRSARSPTASPGRGLLSRRKTVDWT